MKTRETDTDTGGVHFQADPEVHPGIFQLAEVGYFLGDGGVLLVQRSFQINSIRRNLCLVL